MITAGLFNPGFINEGKVALTLSEVSYFKLRLSSFRYKGNPPTIIEGATAEEILNKSKTEYTLLVAVGTFVEPNFFDTLEKLLDSKPDFVGHLLETPIVEGTSYFFPHLQCFLIRTKLWTNFENKSIGEKGSVIDFTLSKVKRSKQNIHDEYTPLEIFSTNKTIKYTGYLEKGYNIINEVAKQGGKIEAFNSNIREVKHYLYAEGSEDFRNILLNKTEKEDQNDMCREQVDWLNRTDPNLYKDCIWVYNTDDPEQILNTVQTIDTLPDSLDNIFCIAGGFFALNFLELCNFNENTSVIYYDINAKALRFKKWLVENWDGTNYLNTVHYYIRNVEKFTPIWHGEVTYSEQDQNEFNQMIKFFGGTKEWLVFWDKYRNLNHEYIEVDLFNNPDPLIYRIKDTVDKNNFTYTSNIFYTEIGMRLYPPGRSINLSEYFVDAVKEHTILAGTKHRFKWMSS